MAPRVKKRSKRRNRDRTVLPTPSTSTSPQDKGKRKRTSKSDGENSLSTPPTSTSPQEKGKRKRKSMDRGECSLPTPPTSTSTMATSSNQPSKSPEKTQVATESLAHEDAKLADTEMTDVSDVEELIWDPETSYVGIKLGEEEEEEGLGHLEPERILWRKEGSPIHDKSEIPPEWKWNDREPDLFRDDIDGQIKRAKERIEAGIIPTQFKVRLRDYEAKKAARDKIQARFPEKSLAVAQRLNELHFMRVDIWKKGTDEYKHLPNINALIHAYESGELEWHEGLVTYWSYGKQLCKPRPWDVEEFLKVNKAHGGHESFWAEGALQLEPFGHRVMIDTVNYAPRKRGDAHYWPRIAVKICGAPVASASDLEFMDDTGASTMGISSTDVKDLHARRLLFGGNDGARLPPLAGKKTSVMADGTTIFVNVIFLEVNYPTPPGGVGYLFPRWSYIQVSVYDDNAAPGSLWRLSGPWLRSQLFTATVPDNKMDLWVTDLIGGLGSVVSQGTPARPGGFLKAPGARALPERIPLLDIPRAERRDY